MNFKTLIEISKVISHRTLVLVVCCFGFVNFGLVNTEFTSVAHALEPSDDASESIHVVEIKEFEFVPADIKVSVGDTIRWVNLDIVPHTATAQDQTWDSGLMLNDATWEMVVTKDAEGDYICTYHPAMKGSINLVD